MTYLIHLMRKTQPVKLPHIHKYCGSHMMMFQFSACLQQTVGELTLNFVQDELNQVPRLEF